MSKDFFEIDKKSEFSSEIIFNAMQSDLTLRRPKFIEVHVPVAPDLAKTVKVGSDHSKNLTSVFYGAKNEKLSFKTVYIYVKFYKINFFLFFF